MKLRLPAHRPAQPRNSGPFRRPKERRGPGRIGLRDPGFLDFRHRGVPTDRGSEFDSAKIDCPLDAFDVRRSLSKKGCPCDNAVDESANKMLKAEFARRESFANTRELQARLSDCVHRYNNFRIHSTLGYMSPVEFRKAGLAL